VEKDIEMDIQKFIQPIICILIWIIRAIKLFSDNNMGRDLETVLFGEHPEGGRKM
jgi:hypothetical protein